MYTISRVIYKPFSYAKYFIKCTLFRIKFHVKNTTRLSFFITQLFKLRAAKVFNVDDGYIWYKLHKKLFFLLTFNVNVLAFQ